MAFARSLYKLPDIIKSIERGEVIFITEGEKCADALWALGLAATCNAMGAGKWSDELTPHFKGADIIIFPDNDIPGKKHAALVSEKLQGIAASVLIVDLPGLAPKGDVANWIDAGGTLEQLQALVESQPKINRAVVNAAEPLADAQCAAGKKGVRRVGLDHDMHG
jgi:putative DNA primase/helicase